MILPSKHIPEHQALLGVGGVLLKELNNPQTVTSLWESVRSNYSVGTFERFILALDMLHIIGSVSLRNGMIERVTS
ncbi:hypothetical protein JYT60_00125 [bacterium AH-315-C08]|nr:hypothetical protein [bacterium AH-315-C08]